MSPSLEQPSVTTWAQAIKGPLAGAMCLWQDLDGLHVAPPPPTAPPTHLLWAWTDQAMVRLRLDDEEVFVASLPWPLPADVGPGVHVSRPLPWAKDDKRVAAVRDADDRAPGEVLGTRWLVVRDDGLGRASDGDVPAVGAITFLRPA